MSTELTPKETQANGIHKPLEIKTERPSHLGPILGILIIILVLIFSGLYLWGGVLSRQAAEMEQNSQSN